MCSSSGPQSSAIASTARARAGSSCPSRSATATPSGGSLATKITIPDGLGGWHVVQLVQKGHIIAQVPFYVEESIVGRGVSSVVVKEGQSFTIHLQGVGWTQLDNTVTVDYDNSYIGYGCGFNSNGDVLLHLNATGGPGTHLIDLYPMLYTLSPSFAARLMGWCRSSPTRRTSLRSRSAITCLRSGSRSPSSSSAARSLAGSRLSRSASGGTSTPTRRANGAGNHQFQRPATPSDSA